MDQKTNIVLVHGAWVDASCWNKVIAPLQSKGFNVTAIQIPLTSLADDVEIAVRALNRQNGPVVLAGHSYGGMVISGAAARVSNVGALVFIAGFGLDEGESVDSATKQGPPSPGAGQIRADDFGFLWIDRAGFPKVFAGDVDPIEANVMAVSQKPLSVASFTDKSTAPAWKKIPSWYLISKNDQTLPPPAQEAMAKRMNATTRSITSSHAATVSHPKEVVEMILQAVAAIEAL